MDRTLARTVHVLAIVMWIGCATERFHRIMLALSLVTVFGAVAGSHGFW